jgi:ABC-2 type transport system permease protein
METIIPKTSTVLSALMKADFTTQWRNRRSVIMVILVPLILLVSWKGLVKVAGAPFVLSNAITFGLIAIGLMGYTNAIARDRDKGIFQRLRVAPLPSWAIMTSRLIVQLAMIMLLVTVIFIVGYDYDKANLTVQEYIFTYFTAIIGGAVYLALGQVIVGLIKNPETVNATSRLVYFAFIIVGTFGVMGAVGAFGVTGKQILQITQWSPYGTVKTILSGSMMPNSWTTDTTYALLTTIGYALIFAVVGIKKFKWDNK